MNDNAARVKTRETKTVKRNADGLIEKTITDIENIGREVRVERVLIGKDGGVEVSLSAFDRAMFTRQQIGELVGNVAKLVWRLAAQSAAGSADHAKGR